MQNLERMRELIQTINEADEAYYKYDAPIMADLDYDRLYDELAALERETGTILSSSPTQRVSGEVLESLTAVRHTRRALPPCATPGRCCPLISAKMLRISTNTWAAMRQS